MHAQQLLSSWLLRFLVQFVCDSGNKGQHVFRLFLNHLQTAQCGDDLQRQPIPQPLRHALVLEKQLQD